MPFSVREIDVTLQHIVLIHHLHVGRKCRFHGAVFLFEHLPMRHLFVHRVEDVQTKLIVIVILKYINDASIIAIILSDGAEEPPRFIAQSHFFSFRYRYRYR